MGIKLYDTVKDKDGKRFRVTEIANNGAGNIVATLKGVHPDGSARRGMPRRVRADVLERDYTRIDLPPVTVKKISDLTKEESDMKPVQAPHARAAEIEKQAVRALSEKEIDDALTASTFGGADAKRVKDLEKDIEVLRAECIDLKEEKKQLEHHVELADGEIAVLKTESAVVKEECRRHLRTIDELKKTNSKMKYAHEEEVRALNDELVEAKIFVKKGNEYSDRLADDEEVFRKMRAFAKSINGMADSIMGLAYMINDETEGRI